MDLGRTWTGDGACDGVEVDYSLPTVEDLQQAREAGDEAKAAGEKHPGEVVAGHLLACCVEDVRGLTHRGNPRVYPTALAAAERRAWLLRLPLVLFKRVSQAVQSDADIAPEEEMPSYASEQP